MIDTSELRARATDKRYHTVIVSSRELLELLDELKATEREMCQDLFEECRTLLRYDGIDKERVRRAVDRIREIVTERLYLLEHRAYGGEDEI